MRVRIKKMMTEYSFLGQVIVSFKSDMILDVASGYCHLCMCPGSTANKPNILKQEQHQSPPQNRLVRIKVTF